MKPELRHDPKLASVSREARLTFIYLITEADDRGYFRASLKYLCGALYPHDEDVTPAALKGWLTELGKIGVVKSLEAADGERVGHIVNWDKHQRIDNASRSFLLEKLGTTAQDEPGAAVVPVSQAVEQVKASTARRKVTEAALRLAAKVVFTYWAARFGHERAVFDRKRQAKLEARLRENSGDVNELLDAIDGAHRDDFITGRDPKAPRAYDGIEVVFRDRAQVERFVALSKVKRPGGAQHPFLIQYEVEHGRAE